MSPQTILPSAQKVRFFLHTSIAVLVPFYLFAIQRIDHLERMQRMENVVGLSLPSRVPSPSQKLPPAKRPLRCGWNLLYYFMAPSLLWNAVVIWRRRSRRRLLLLVNISLVVICSAQFSGDTCYIEMGGESNYASIVARRDETAWSESYLPKKIMDGYVRISFRLHDPSDVPRPDKFAGVPGYKCSGADLGDLPPSLSGRTVLNFTTSIATELKVAFVGDSISEQFAQSFDAAVLGTGYEANRWARTYVNGRNNENVHDCLSTAAPVRGGGVTAFWRVATLMSTSTRSQRNVCQHQLKFWNENQALTLVDHRYSDFSDHQNVTLGNNMLPRSVTAFDAIVMRLNHGWLKIEEITEERIVEAINLTNKYLGAQTIIISTLPLNNNVVTYQDWEGIARINQMVRDIARSWAESPHEPGSVEWVLVQEFGNFTNQVLRMNAKHIKLINDTITLSGFSEKGWELAGSDFLLKRLSAATYWYPSTAMVCAEPTYSSRNEKNEKVSDCIRNKISRDGAHWCVENIGSRYSASVACLLGCVHNGKGPIANNAHDSERVRVCEGICNEQFMSIIPIHEEWIGSPKISLFSKSV